MRSAADLERALQQIDGGGYGAYKRLHGWYDLGFVRLAIDHVQSDPYAPPSKARLVIGREVAGFPRALLAGEERRVAVGDFLLRRCHEAIRRLAPGGDRERGSVAVGAPGQQVLPSTGVLVADDRIEARITVGLPAAGRRVRGRAAARLLLDVLPDVADAALVYRNLDAAALDAHVALYLDQQWLRRALDERGLVAFVGDGAVLARRSGDSDLPLTEGAVPFRSPESLRVSFDLPSGRTVHGMGVPRGVTVIVGGGYHGKSTLLRAIERGVYPHIAGDGREWVITRGDAVTIRAEDGRAVTGVDIAPFISNLPSGIDTRRFGTANASGSTSQAANLVEAVESGSRLLLIDEDTSATNFMIRDERMRRLVPARREPITPFVDRVRPLLEERGVSTILVAGGSGAFFDVADLVIALDAYVPGDVTEEARKIAAELGDRSADAGPGDAGPVFGPSEPRRPAPGTLRAQGRHDGARARGDHAVQLGKQVIDLSAVPHLVHPAQTAAIAHALDLAARLCDGRRTIREVVDEIFALLADRGLDALSPYEGHPGHLAAPRPQEVYAAICRYRGLTLV